MHSSTVIPDSAQPEQVMLRVRTHGRRLFVPSVLMVAAAGAAGYWAGTFSETWLNVAVWVGFAAFVFLWCATGVRWLTSRAVLTQRRLIIKRGVFVQHSSDLSYARIREVRTRRTLMQRLFGSGQVMLLTGSEPSVVLRDVARCDLVCESLRELIDRYFAESQQLQAGDTQATANVYRSQSYLASDTQDQRAFTPENPPKSLPQADFDATIAVHSGRSGYENGRMVRRPRIGMNGPDSSL